MFPFEGITNLDRSIDEHLFTNLPVQSITYGKWQASCLIKRAIKTSNLFYNSAVQRVEIATLRDIQTYLVTNRVC